MTKIVCVVFFAIFFSIVSFGQTETHDPLIIDKLDASFFTRDNVSYYLDSTRSLSFEDIKKIQFKKSSEPLLHYQSKTWYKFYLKPEVKSKTLMFSPSHSDSTNVYVPYKGYYKKFTLGHLTDIDVDFTIFESSLLYAPTDSIDFDKPFYYDKVILTKSGKLNADNSGYIVLANNSDIWKNKRNKRIGYTKTEHVYLAIFFIAMLIFFVNYFVTKDKNFLNYSFYLLFTILIFSNHLSFLINLFNNIHPLFIDSISHFSVIMAAASYFYFVISFVDVKYKYPKIYPLVKYTIIGSLIFAAFSIIQLLFFPYLIYRFHLLKIYDVVFVIISITVFIYLISKRLTLLKRIVVFGSFLLILGQLLSIVTGNATYFIGAVILEIIAFSSVVSIQNKIVARNQALSQANLRNEKIERQNLEKIDDLKSRFITNITHEFRTPLTIIMGYTDNLKELFSKKPEINNSLNTIEQNSKNLLNLVNQMLDLAKLEKGQLNINLIQNDIVAYSKHIIDSFLSIASDKDINLNFTASPSKIVMDYDAEKWRQIISNLILNALKFSPQNSELKVNIIEQDNHSLQVIIADQGFGIPEAKLPFIFDRFYQVENAEHKVSQGTGVGLTLTKELVELFNGTIIVQSKVNVGTVFTIQLPITNTAKEQDFDLNKNPVSIGTVVPELNDIIIDQDSNTVLIVEDNADMARYIASCLQPTYKVTFAKDGKEGLELAEQNIPDIVVTDVMMPIMDGFELTQKLQANTNTNHIPIIMLTSKAMQEDKLEGITSGADAYLTKPFQKEELRLRMQMLIAKRKKLQENYSVNTVVEKTELKKELTDKNLIFLNKAIKGIHEHLDDSNFGATELAKFMLMSDSQLYRKLKAISNTSTAIFIRKVRLEKAKELLKTSDLTISEIAYSTGFNDPNWFSKIFKEEFKESPSSFRN